ncbi:MAG: glycerophosphodiester phosphodiesterase [Pseudomonadota bacterium]|nr:glycerophosphodiester phosphodiesterase [Pseudomonadota bacterium]
MRLSPFAPIDHWLAPPPPAGRIVWLRGACFAHRGLWGGLWGERAPENSLSAFARAVARGLGIECDVQLTADGEAVVFHDFALARLTGADGAVIDRTAAQLSAIPYTGGTETIPTLRATLDAIGGRVPLLIELKSRGDWPIAQLCAAVQRDLTGYRGAHAVMSFDPRAPAWFARHAPATARGLIVSEEKGRGARHTVLRHLALWRARPDFLAYDIRDLPSRFAAKQRQRGLPIATWTVRSPELLARAHAHADAPIAEAAGVPVTAA